MRPTRLHWVMVAAAVLYLGAFATGWAAGGWLGWAAVFGLLTLWTVTMRPASAWSGPGAAGALRSLAALGVLAVLALGVWGLGRLAGLALPPPPLWAGPALALAGLALGRAVWSPAREAALDAVLTEALAGIAATAPPGQTDHGLDPAVQAPVEAALDALPPGGADPAAVVAVLEGSGRALGPTDLVWLLIHRAMARGAPRDRLALVLGVTDPRIAAEAWGVRALAHAFNLVGEADDAPALALLVARTEVLLAAQPEGWRDLPRPLSLFLAARMPALDPDAAVALRRLACQVRAREFGCG